jgi:hypothetical protein
MLYDGFWATAATADNLLLLPLLLLLLPTGRTLQDAVRRVLGHCCHR